MLHGARAGRAHVLTESASHRRALEAVGRRGILLVYPLANRPEPRSLWGELHPRTPLRWSWDEGADPRVARMWQLREVLARSTDVVYAKWFQGRATFFSRPVFQGLVAALACGADPREGLSRTARELLELLEDDSPQSTKVLRGNADLRGKPNESTYARAMKELWSRLLIVGVGEVDDGAFPSLAMSATRNRFEELLPGRSAGAQAKAADAALAAALAEAPLFARFVTKTIAAMRASKTR